MQRQVSTIIALAVGLALAAAGDRAVAQGGLMSGLGYSPPAFSRPKPAGAPASKVKQVQYESYGDGGGYAPGDGGGYVPGYDGGSSMGGCGCDGCCPSDGGWGGGCDCGGCDDCGDYGCSSCGYNNNCNGSWCDWLGCDWLCGRS